MAPDMMRPVRIAHVATIDLTLRVLLGAQLIHLHEAGADVTAISAPGPWVSDLEARGIRHISWTKATRAWDPAADLGAFFELMGILRRERFDVVHTHNAKPGVMGRVAARVVGTPCVLNTVHGFDARPDDPLLRRIGFMGLEWLAAQCSDVELFQSSADLARASRLRMKQPSRMALLGNGVDLSRFNPEVIDSGRVAALRQSLGIASQCRVVGTVGRLVRDKGYLELFDAAHEVRRRFPDVVFLVVGDRDPDKEDAIGEAEMRRQHNFVFAGWREDMPEFYALMDVFALPTWREGFPRSPMEAAAMGKPLILSDIPGCREVAREGVEALFVPPRDPASLAEAIVSVLSDPARGSRIGRAARIRALAKFDEVRVAELVLRSTRATLARKGVHAELDAGVPG